MTDLVTYALLYRTAAEWRISVRTPDELACGSLEQTASTESFQAAAREFEDLLTREWGVSGPFDWDEFKPGWWGVEWVQGALGAEKDTRT